MIDTRKRFLLNLIVLQLNEFGSYLFSVDRETPRIISLFIYIQFVFKMYLGDLLEFEESNRCMYIMLFHAQYIMLFHACILI